MFAVWQNSSSLFVFFVSGQNYLGAWMASPGRDTSMWIHETNVISNWLSKLWRADEFWESQNDCLIYLCPTLCPPCLPAKQKLIKIITGMSWARSSSWESSFLSCHLPHDDTHRAGGQAPSLPGRESLPLPRPPRRAALTQHTCQEHDWTSVFINTD